MFCWNTSAFNVKLSVMRQYPTELKARFLYINSKSLERPNMISVYSDSHTHHAWNLMSRRCSYCECWLCMYIYTCYQVISALLKSRLFSSSSTNGWYQGTLTSDIPYMVCLIIDSWFKIWFQQARSHGCATQFS